MYVSKIIILSVLAFWAIPLSNWLTVNPSTFIMPPSDVALEKNKYKINFKACIKFTSNICKF